MQDKVIVIGIGQAGGRIADEFSKSGYDSIALNTSKEDLEPLTLRDKILFGKHGGSGGSRAASKEQLKEDIEKVFSKVLEKVAGKEFIVLASSVGGGTGSGSIVGLAINLFQQTKAKIINVLVTAKKEESYKMKSNLNGLMADYTKTRLLEATNIMLVENEGSIFETNRNIVRKFNGLFKDDLGVSIKTFDRADLKMALSGGYISIVNTVGIKPLIEHKDPIFDIKAAKNIEIIHSGTISISEEVLKNFNGSKNLRLYRNKKERVIGLFCGLNAPSEYFDKISIEIEKEKATVDTLGANEYTFKTFDEDSTRKIELNIETKKSKFNMDW